MRNQPTAELAAAFKALANENRLKVFELIRHGRNAKSCGGKLPGGIPDNAVCVCEILDKLDVSAPTLSHHLKELRAAGLVDATQHGQWSYYTVRPGALEKLAAFLSTAPRQQIKRTNSQPEITTSARRRASK